MIRLFILLFIGFTISLQAQPLSLGWSDMLQGKWRVEKMNNETVDKNVYGIRSTGHKVYTLETNKT